MKFKYTFVTIMIILLGGFFWSNGSDSDYPIPRKIDIEIDNFRGNCTSCSENYNPEDLGAVCCDQASEYFTCSELESNYNWICSGCECDSDPDFVSMYGCTDLLAANYSEDAVYDYGTCWYPELTADGGVTEIALNWVPYGTICNDPTACNTNEESLSGCVYAKENYDCYGNCTMGEDCAGECDGSAVEDCSGECGGDAVVDECGECGGDGIDEGDCDCDGNVDDCLGDCGGDAAFDACGACDNDPSNDCPAQCDGEFDDCGMCTGEGTDLEYNYAMDCLGVCPGADGYIDAQEDVCGVCQGNGYVDWGCNDSGSTCWDIADGDCDCAGHVDDCLGICGGSGVEDECGVCEGGGKGVCYLDGKEVCDLEECTIYYNVYKTEEGVDGGYDLLTGLITGTEFTDIGFEYINTFSYYVTYIDAWGNESSPSNIAAARPIVSPDFTYSETTKSMAYSFGSIKLLDLGDIDILTTDDWVGAFNGDQCVGLMQINENTAFCDCDTCDSDSENDCVQDCATMYLYGDDGSAASSGYMSAGDIPSFKIWDGSTNNYYGTDNPTSDCLAFEAEGACCSEMLAADIFGCTNPESCTYDSDATVNDGSCLYLDCAGVCDGDASLDDCGDCNGGNAADLGCGCNEPAPSGCDNECGSTAVDDCSGECDGTSVMDNCGECVPDGDTSCVLGCDGNWCNGENCHQLVDDACGDCDGNNSVSCLPDWEFCTSHDQCESDYCDECGDCGGTETEPNDCPPDGLAYNQSTQQAFYNVSNARDSLGVTLEYGVDWVGAFKDGLCVGSTKWAGAQTQIAVMGDDGYGYTEGYMLPGETPTFIVFDDGSAESMFTVFPYDVEGSLAFSPNNWVNMELLPEFSHFERQLDVGANLISFYVLPLVATIDIVFESCEESCVITEGKAACYDPEGGWNGSLLYIEPEKGYWILVNTPCTLSFAGFNYNPSLEYHLHMGANLISFPAQGTCDLGACIPDDVEYLFEAIVCEGSAAMNTENGWVGYCTSFSGGSGYWVIVSEPLSFSFILDDGIGREIDVYSETMPTFGDFKVNQSTEQAFYFVDKITLLDGNVEIGDWLLSYNGDVLTGIRQWQGVMIDVPVMGASDDLHTSGYFLEGGLPSFKILKQSTGDLLSLDGDINKWSSNGVFIINSLAEVEPAPEEYHLNSIYPNPFNPITTISFGLAEDTEISIKVYNIQGSVVETLANQYMEAGYHSVVWDAGQHSSGIYFVKMLTSLSTGGITGKIENVSIQKMMLIK